MPRLMLLGFLTLSGVGLLSAMELRTPPRSAVAITQPRHEPTADTSDSHDTLAKADRLAVAPVSIVMPEQAVMNEEGARPKDISIDSSEPPKPVVRHLQHRKKVPPAPRPKSQPKVTAIKQAAVVQRSKIAGDTEPCRLKAFGGLRRALNSTDCEI